MVHREAIQENKFQSLGEIFSCCGLLRSLIRELRCVESKNTPYSMPILTFIEQSNQVSSSEQLLALFERVLREFGIDMFLYSHSLKDGEQGSFHTYPEDWVRRYTDRGYIKRDPTYRLARQMGGVFEWQSVSGLIPLKKEELSLLEEADEAGLRSGITASFHLGYGRKAGFGFASRTRQMLGRNDLSTVYALAGQFQLVFQSLNRRDVEISVRLTDRQTEILHWTAAGKSRAVIAEILHITEHAVDDHLRHIFKKLQCNDRVVAVLKAVQMGLIAL